MTGLLLRRDGARLQLPPTLTATLEHAVSERTANIAKQVKALQRGPTPAALQGRAYTVKSVDERLFDALATVKMLTSQVAMHLAANWRAGLFRQLDSLHDLTEWEQGDEPVEQASFSTFLKAIVAINPERRPGLGLSHSGHLIATWTTGEDRLTIEFLPDNRVRWVLSMKSDEGLERYGGDIPVTKLIMDLSRHNPQHWFSRGNQDNEHT